MDCEMKFSEYVAKVMDTEKGYAHRVSYTSEVFAGKCPDGHCSSLCDHAWEFEYRNGLFGYSIRLRHHGICLPINRKDRRVLREAALRFHTRAAVRASGLFRFSGSR